MAYFNRAEARERMVISDLPYIVLPPFGVERDAITGSYCRVVRRVSGGDVRIVVEGGGEWDVAEGRIAYRSIAD